VPRTPLFDSLQRAFRIAALSAKGKAGVPPIDELIDMAYSRRRFIRDSATAAAAAALVAGCSRESSPPAPAAQTSGGGARIAIVGGGMAGLNAAYKLQKAGLRAKIFEGSDRTGGRMFTASNLLGEGITTELGGEFIDSTHEEMLNLMEEFGLQKLDTFAPENDSLKKETYFINGRHYTHEQAARAFVPLAKKIFEDYDALEDVDYDTEGGGTKFDKMSIAQYLDGIGATGWMRELLDVAYVTEYGLDTGEQSSLNFTFLIGTGDIENTEAFDLLGESDERYKVRGGNQKLVDELARRLESQIQRRHRLESIKSKGDAFTLTFQADSGVVEEDADIVLFAIPFTMMRDVNIQVPLSPLKKKAIQELGYGANAKVLVGFDGRPWQKLGYSGATYTDEPFQLAWENSFMQPGMAGGLTLYSGGKLAIDVGQGTAEEQAKRLMAGVERAYPGATKARNGKVSRFHWPSFPWTKASYACYKPGQWTTIAGSEGLPEGNLFFAGEHCSYDFQGYMNGAAQTGADTAKEIMGKLSGSKAKAARLMARRHFVRFA
jgi:monoamine oxidase